MYSVLRWRVASYGPRYWYPWTSAGELYRNLLSAYGSTFVSVCVLPGVAYFRNLRRPRQHRALLTRSRLPYALLTGSQSHRGDAMPKGIFLSTSNRHLVRTTHQIWHVQRSV